MSDTNAYDPGTLASLASFHEKYDIGQASPAPVDEWPDPATAVLIGIDFVTNTVTYEFGDLRALQQKRLALVDDWVTVLVEDGSEDVFITGAWSETQLCRVCGCSDDLACDEGCEWVEDDLCSACVGRPQA
jgi:hypothetical protein